MRNQKNQFIEFKLSVVSVSWYQIQTDNPTKFTLLTDKFLSLQANHTQMALIKKSMMIQFIEEK